MGTRARVNVYEREKIIVSIYRQMDGYPDGLGQQVADFAADMAIINGISGQKAGEAANGMGCFAAQLISKLKDDIGSVYIRDTSEESHGEEYSYNLREKDGRIWIDALEGSMTAFGNPGDTETDMKSIFSGFAKDFKVTEEEEV
jgi:hypothetical protein